MADVPYVGCGVLASSCGMDKVTMKSLFVQAGLPICKHIWFLRSQWRNNPAKVIRKVTTDIGLPCFVKPANLGSSVGVSRATDKKSLSKAIDLAAEYDRKIIVEEELVAREIECAVLGNDEPKASLPGEYVVYEEAAQISRLHGEVCKHGQREFCSAGAVVEVDDDEDSADGDSERFSRLMERGWRESISFCRATVAGWLSMS